MTKIVLNEIHDFGLIYSYRTLSRSSSETEFGDRKILAEDWSGTGILSRQGSMLEGYTYLCKGVYLSVLD